jgi:LytS/YehU family sensor histidine kinase
VCWSGLYFGIKYYEMLQQQREAALQASALAQEAQVKMLRYQLNPHFMFNTLNAISTLILDGQGKVANQAVGKLSEFLRHTLDQDPMKKVTLRQELDALDLYLGIEKLRFAERLRLEFDVEDAAQQALVPSLILQPLIENALKYAVAPREEGGRLRLEAHTDGAVLRLVVQDDGPGLPVGVNLGEGRGVGFRNTRDRLAVLYGEHQKIAVRFARPGLRVEIEIPFERAVEP